MGLPSPEQLEELSDIIKGLTKGRTKKNKIGFWSEEDQRAELSKLGAAKSSAPAPTSRPFSDKVAAKGKSLAQSTVSYKVPAVATAALHGGLQVGGSGTVDVLGHVMPLATTIAPVGAAFSAWINMATVAVQAGKVFDLYALRDDARSEQHARTTYSCFCGNCAKNIQYIIDKKERNVGIVAISVGTLGVAGLGKLLHSGGKRLWSKITGEKRPKEIVSREIVESGRSGCLAAMGTVFLLSGSWTQGYRDKATMKAAVLTLTATDGWEKFKNNW